METRINKYLSGAGFCSRREADRLVAAGRVLIGGQTASMGSKVLDGQPVFVDGQPVRVEKEQILLAVNKPPGIVCTTTDRQGPNNIVDFVGYPKRIFPVGRLDKDSQGLLLMTNNGEMMNRILRSANGHEKEYVVEVDREIDGVFIRAMAGGVYLEALGQTTKPCRVYPEGRTRFRIILTQGLNRQIRRMCEQLGRRVVRLERIRIMNITLGTLPSGAIRPVTEPEYETLIKLLEESS